MQGLDQVDGRTAAAAKSPRQASRHYAPRLKREIVQVPRKTKSRVDRPGDPTEALVGQPGRRDGRGRQGFSLVDAAQDLAQELGEFVEPVPGFSLRFDPLPVRQHLQVVGQLLLVTASRHR